MSYNHLSPGKYIEGINLCIENAQNIFDIANLAKQRGNIGLANSLFILSCEESIKAFAIYNAFLIDDNRDLSPMFHSHNEKLTILKEGYELISSETLAMEKSFKQAITELPNATPLEVEKRVKELHGNYHQQLFDEMNEKDIESNRKWWDSANMIKQKGFYVELKNGKWISPMEITKEDVLETERKALLVLGYVLGYKDVDEKTYKSKK